ncbi:MAG: hypothetical protein KatS3mg129_1247 [Leptospiraceae bacterium]|nr:MAG: hypothetical protein KatS3mg129_1247 [Leptospiraceae bacterium]
MNFDLLYSNKKPLKLSKKDKDKILEKLFNISLDKDKKIELYLYENWKKLLGKYANKIELKYVKNYILYVKVDSKIVLQEVLFLLPQINQKLYLAIGENIKTIREIPYHKIKDQEIYTHTTENKITKSKNIQNIKKHNDNSYKNSNLLEDIKKILKNKI